MICLGPASDQLHRAEGYELLTRIALAGGRREEARRVVADARAELGDSGFLGIWRALEQIAARLDEPTTRPTRGPSPTAAPEPTRPNSLREPLTERELEILALVAEGLSNREIAHRMGVSSATVKTHLYNGYGKLGVRRRTMAVLVARQHGLIA